MAKKIIFKRYLRVFQNQRIAMPLKNAKKIYSLYRNKILSFHAQFSHVEYRQGQYYIFFNDRKSPLVTKYFIDAAGLAGSVDQTENPLIKNIVKRNLINTDDFGFIDVAPDSMKAINAMGDKENFYMLGGLIQGTYIAANLMESIVELSHQIAKSIATSVWDKKLTDPC